MIVLLILTVLINCDTTDEGEKPVIKTDPPFSGTIFIDPDIIIEDDPSTFVSLEYTGQATRTMFDRRVNDWITDEPYLFVATFDDGLEIEFQVNAEFGSEADARPHALKYAEVIGRLPTALRKDVETSWIHKGDQLFGGGNNNLLIHTEQGEKYIDQGILEETFVHEASHTSLDAYHANAAGWIEAQKNDPAFISTYARDNPEREDIAESFLPYLAIRFRADRITDELKTQIEEAIPERISYFDELDLNLYPIE
ncbi:MAG: hypothetical protein JXQ90_06125 [Cyclobacteriaceae bacterium]